VPSSGDSLTAVVMKSIFFWDIMSSRPLALLDPCFHIGFLLGLFFDSEDGGSMFLRNVGWISTDHMALCLRR
jgi:hypothetical protein